MAMATMADRIRHARRLAHFSQAKLARAVGVRPSAVAQWEGTRGTAPTVTNLIRIATETGVAFEWLATGRGPSRMALDGPPPAVMLHDFAQDHHEERLLLGYRRLPRARREAFIALFELTLGASTASRAETVRRQAA